MKKTQILGLILSILASSCNKIDQQDPTLIIDPIFEELKVSWVESEKKEGNGPWINISSPNTLRLYHSKGAEDSLFFGQYEYEPINSKLSIPNAYYFIKRQDSLIFYKPANGQNSNETYEIDTLASVRYQLNADSILILENRLVTPCLLIKYSRQ